MRWVLGQLLSATIALGPAGVLAAPRDFETLLEQGSQLVEQGDHAAAAPILAEAYRAMPREQQVGDFGRYVISGASDAYLSAANASTAPDPLLTECQALLTEYFDALEQARHEGMSTVADDEDEQQLRARLDVVRDRLAESQPVSAASTQPGSGEVSRDRRRPDAVGIALVAGGAAALGVGLGLLGYGARFPDLIAQAKQDARDEHGLAPDEDPPGWADHEVAQRKKGRALVGGGVVLGVVGAGAVAWGIVRLVGNRRSDRAVKASVSVSPQGAGAWVRWAVPSLADLRRGRGAAR
jgi:hypothetical protein